MKVLSIYAPIPPSQYRTNAGDKMAASSWEAIGEAQEMGCELILHHGSGRAYFSVPDGFEHPALMDVAQDWRIATYLYEKTGVQHTKFRIETTRNIGVVTYPAEPETEILCIDNISVGKVENVSLQTQRNTVDITMLKSNGLHHVIYDNNNEILMTIAPEIK